jgi:hypothetical protein
LEALKAISENLLLKEINRTVGVSVLPPKKSYLELCDKTPKTKDMMSSKPQKSSGYGAQASWKKTRA